MGDYKFDRFYYSEDESDEHYLSEIEDLSDDNLAKYKGKMYCPLCRGPQLSLVKGPSGSFLRTYPKQPHLKVGDDMCPYECDTASKSVMENYIAELREKNKIKSVLEAALRRLFSQELVDIIVPKGTEKHSGNPLVIEQTESDKTIKKNIIPHYSFKSWGKNIPEDQLLIVYGKVYVELKEVQSTHEAEEKESQIYIRFRDMKTKRLITSCLKPKTMEITEGNYYVAVLGKCYHKEKDGHIYYNLWVNSPTGQSIVLKPYSK